MGKRYVLHSDMCGCERCAIQAERDNPQPVYDEIEDEDVLECGCHFTCTCDYDMPDEDFEGWTIVDGPAW